ncbi:alpha-1B-glycoprotein [Echinops telfairi]|uniref:Alpha-1B-glycoprotein n=1 Tax=Echinops telfairi TaxID=9371 RepID=A0AC55D944_ECHTE|nr:alpha-1B-glycoprotein [Echinops telfairi]
MSVLLASLLIWGFALSPATMAAIFIETRPTLWMEAESLLEPWANVTLTCRAYTASLGFQLFKDGVAQEPVNVLALEYRFVLGAVTSETRGLYRCRTGMGDRWTGLSQLVEVSGAESLPQPSLSAKPVSWITPHLNTTVVCSGGLQGVTFLLRREGDDEFLEVAEASKDVKATFLVHRAGNYSCSYRTHASGHLSESSATVNIEGLEVPPPPTLSIQNENTAVLLPGTKKDLLCVAPLSGVQFQLWRGDVQMLVSMYSTTPGRVYFSSDTLASGLYTCRYSLYNSDKAWSSDSAPVELLLSDGSLPPPELQAEPSATPKPGALTRLRCRGPRAGLRFALEQKSAWVSRWHGLRSPVGAEALWELLDVSALDSGNYSCVYTDPATHPAGSARSAALELLVEGPPPRPRLQPLWQGEVTPGRDVVLRCVGPVSNLQFELVREGEEAEAVDTAGGDLVLNNVGPQHAGNYRCRYRVGWPSPLVSELSDPVELRVAGS